MIVKEKLFLFIFCLLATYALCVVAYTPTQAYLEHVSHASILQKINLDYQVHTGFFNQLIAEEATAPNYCIFYHGQSKEAAVYRHLTDKLNKALQLPVSELSSLRPNNQWSAAYYAEDYLTTYQSNWQGIYDEIEPHKTNLLSVNFSPIGCINQYSGGESSYWYWINAYSYQFPHYKVRQMLVYNFIQSDTFFLANYIEQMITKAIALNESTTGILLQFFIPKEKVDKYVYICWAKGCPITQAIYVTINNESICPGFNPNAGFYTQISPYINLYITAPQGMKHNMAEFQARLLLHNDFLQNKVGAYYKEYILQTPEAKAAYNKALDAIVQVILNLRNLAKKKPITDMQNIPQWLQNDINHIVSGL